MPAGLALKVSSRTTTPAGEVATSNRCSTIGSELQPVGDSLTGPPARPRSRGARHVRQRHRPTGIEGQPPDNRAGHVQSAPRALGITADVAARDPRPNSGARVGRLPQLIREPDETLVVDVQDGGSAWLRISLFAASVRSKDPKRSKVDGSDRGDCRGHGAPATTPSRQSHRPRTPPSRR